MSIQTDQSTSAETVTVTPTPHSTTSVTNQSKVFGFSMEGETVESSTIKMGELNDAKAGTVSAHANQVFKQVSLIF